MLRESAKFSASQTYDIFLSHSFQDATYILGIKQLLEEQELSVYVDWIADPGVDRTNVTRSNAEMIRLRMKHCRSLIYATSNNTGTSKWMPWELGYFDGHKPTKVAVLPFIGDSEDTWAGQEYLSLYPAIEQLRSRSGKDFLYVKPDDAWLRIKDFISN